MNDTADDRYIQVLTDKDLEGERLNPQKRYFLTKKAAALVLGCDYQTLGKMINNGDIRAYKLRGRNGIYVEYDDIQALLIPLQPETSAA